MEMSRTSQSMTGKQTQSKKRKKKNTHKCQMLMTGSPKGGIKRKEERGRKDLLVGVANYKHIENYKINMQRGEENENALTGRQKQADNNNNDNDN